MVLAKCFVSEYINNYSENNFSNYNSINSKPSVNSIVYFMMTLRGRLY